MTKFDAKDDAVSSVVGEMLLLTIVLILTAVFAVSAFSFLPGDREDIVDVDAEISDDKITFWHKGGDAVSKDQLTAAVYDGVTPKTVTVTSLKNAAGTDTPVFDLGGSYTVSVSSLSIGDEIRLSTDRTIIYTGVAP